MRLEIEGQHANIRFSACHFISGHEKCGRLHGHSYVLSLRVHGDTGPGGMVMDFIPLKQALKGIVEELDHRVIIPANSKRISVTVEDEVTVRSGPKRYVFPLEDVVLLDTEESSAEEMAQVLLSRLLDTMAFPPNVHRVELGIHEELGQSAWASRELKG